MNLNNVLHGDCREILPTMPENFFHAVVTDPPYELGFMGKKWDSSGVAFDVDVWRAVLRVMKPGAYLLAFGGTRTYHRMACAIEDAGLTLRDCVMWVYGSGFPKSLDISKAIDKSVGVNHGSENWAGWGTALKPAYEPVIVAQKPIGAKNIASNVLSFGVGGLNLDATRIATDESTARKRSVVKGAVGFGDNVPSGMGGNGHELGRWPANVIFDEEAAAMLDAQAGLRTSGEKVPKAGGQKTVNTYGKYKDSCVSYSPASSGGASRFFYVSKTSTEERGENNDHPTVKPLDLMSYLVKLVTPKGGIVLDPFAGSGTTLMACKRLDFDYVGVEIEAKHIQIIERRLAAMPESLFKAA